MSAERSTPSVLYRTIVADPPWPLSARTATPDPGSLFARFHRPAYPTLSVAEITALPVGTLAGENAHLYLWTTQRYLRDAFDVVSAWGFGYSTTLVWSKPPKGIAGTFVCSAEFILFCRRGTLNALRRHIGSVFSWPRMPAHSQKPEAFLDIVESVSPGPYLELFARRNRLGWDTWGNEALEHVELSA